MSTFRITKTGQEVPQLSGSQKELLYKLLSAEFGISGLQQMEMAAMMAAELARSLFLKGNAKEKPVIVLAGRGFKAGVALTAARRLHGWGAKVRVWHADLPPVPTEFTGAALGSIQRMGILSVENPKSSPALVLDGLLEAGQDARKYPFAAEMIFWANTQIAPVLSIDLPSGIHPDSGAPLHAPVMRANATLAFGLPYQGIFTERARPHVGEIYLSDIGAPAAVWSAPGMGGADPTGIFAESPLLRLR